MAHHHEKRRGRPTLPPAARRSVTIPVRLTPGQAAAVEARAAAADLTPAALAALLLRGAPVPPPAAAFAHAGQIARLATRLGRIERLAEAGRVVGVPAAELARLADALQAAGMLALGLRASRRP